MSSPRSIGVDVKLFGRIASMISKSGVGAVVDQGVRVVHYRLRTLPEYVDGDAQVAAAKEHRHGWHSYIYTVFGGPCLVATYSGEYDQQLVLSAVACILRAACPIITLEDPARFALQPGSICIPVIG